MIISIIKKIITVNLILLFFLYSGINNENNIYAQMPSTSGDLLFEESECRNNPGTGEVFCEVSLDTSVEIMTSTVAPIEFYEGQGIWFQGCRDPEVDYINYDSVYIENVYASEAGSLGLWGQKVTNFYNMDPKAKVTYILFRGNVNQGPGRQYIQCKYQFFTVNSPLVQPGGPFHNAQWEADRETQRLYEEAEKIRREADRARAEEELLRAKQEAEIELQRQEEERKRLEEDKEQLGIQNLFEQVGQGPVANIFGDTFTWQPPDHSEMPLGPFINLTEIPSDASEVVTDCVANYISQETGMSYEQAYMDFAFTLGVRSLEEPDFYYDAVTNCMQLNFSKLLSGIWENVAAYQNRPDLNIFLDKCVIPHLSDTLNLRRSIIVDDLNSVKEGKRSLSKEEMLGAYDCLYHHLENIWPLPPGSNENYYPNGQEMLADYILGSQEIPGEFCIIDTISDANQIYSPQAESIVDELVGYVVGRTDGWYFLEVEPNAKTRNEILNIVIGCNNELEWLRGYNASLYSNDQGVTLEDVFARLLEPDFRQCILEEFIQFPSNMTNNEAETVYDTMLMGFMDHEDPTEYSNRPLGEEQYHAIVDCSNRFNVDLSVQSIIAPYLWQYTLFIDEIEFTWSQGLDSLEKFNTIIDCTSESFKNLGFDVGYDTPDVGVSAAHLITKIFYSGGDLNTSNLARDYTDIELRAVYECLEEKPEFEWIDNLYNDQYDYEPVYESSLFTQSNVDFEEAAADFRQTIVSNNPDIEGSNKSSSIIDGDPLESLRIELVDLARGSVAEDCMIANLAREKGETENYIRTSYITNLIWEPTQRPSSKETIALENCESQIRAATQGKGGLKALLKYGAYSDPDYLSQPSDSQRACMIREYINVFGYMIEGPSDKDSIASKAIAEFSLPGSYNGYHPILEDIPNLRPPSSLEVEVISNCRVEDLFVYEGDRLRKLIPGINTSNLPLGEIATPTGLAIIGIMITLFFSTLQMIRGK